MARAGKVVPAWYLKDFFGLKSPKEAEFAGQLLVALEKISPDLAPRVLHHPLIHEITRGPAAFDGLLAQLQAAKDDDERAIVIDAIAEICTQAPATHAVVTALEAALAGAKSNAVASVAARGLAAAQSEAFLEHQRNLLGSNRPEEVRIAAKLIGFGKYRRAAPVLLEILRIDNLLAAEPVVWALGEIGDAEAVPLLHNLLTRSLLVEVVLSALGKIGSRASTVRVIPYLLEGSVVQREKAAEALARIARKNDGSLGDPGLDETVKKTLEKVIDADESRLVRFYGMITYSLLGGRVEPNRMLAALGGTLSKKELDAVGGLLKPTLGRQEKQGGPTKPKRGRKPV